MPTPLAVLLQARMDEHGWRLRDVTRPPDGNRPGAPARATMSFHLQRGKWLGNMPREKTIEELAAAVRISPDEIRHAAWMSLAANRDSNLPPASSEAVDGQPVGRSRQGGPVLALDGLTMEQQDALRSIAEAYRAQNPKAKP